MKALPQYQAQLQIINGWYHISKELISYELFSASKRLDIDLKSLEIYIPIPNSKRRQFSIQYQFELWKLFLQKDDLLSTYPHYRFPATSSPTSDLTQDYLIVDGFIICQSLLNLCNWPISTSVIIINFITSVSFALLPIIFIFIFPSTYSLSTISNKSKFSDETNLTLFITFHISAFLINFFLFQSLLYILFICKLDTFRKFQVFLLLSSLIRSHDIDIDTVQISTRSAVSPSSSEPHHNRQSFLQLLKSSGRIGNDSISSMTSPTHLSDFPGTNRSRKTSILLSDRSIISPRSAPTVSNSRQKTNPQHSSVVLEDYDDGQIDELERAEPLTDASEEINRAISFQSDSGIDPNDYEFKAYVGNDSLSIVPKIDFNVNSNFLTWSSLRLVLHSFGDRMKFRIDCYIGNFAILPLL